MHFSQVYFSKKFINQSSFTGVIFAFSVHVDMCRSFLYSSIAFRAQLELKLFVYSALKAFIIKNIVMNRRMGVFVLGYAAVY